MEVFAIMGFIFGLPALSLATANKAQMKRLNDELEELRKVVEDLHDRQSSS